MQVQSAHSYGPYSQSFGETLVRTYNFERPNYSLVLKFTLVELASPMEAVPLLICIKCLGVFSVGV